MRLLTMWSSSNKLLLTTFSLLILISSFTTPHYISNADAQIQEFSSFDWSSSSMSMISDDHHHIIDDAEFDDEINSTDIIGTSSSDTNSRRSLYWRRRKVYYISYGALSANRVPCPPRSGRSYYTHNCFRARGPANPYHRGCSCIARCRR